MVVQVKTKHKKKKKKKKRRVRASNDYVSCKHNWSPRKGNFCSRKFMCAFFCDRRNGRNAPVATRGKPYWCDFTWRRLRPLSCGRMVTASRCRSHSSINYWIIFVYMNLRSMGLNHCAKSWLPCYMLWFFCSLWARPSRMEKRRKCIRLLLQSKKKNSELAFPIFN